MNSSQYRDEAGNAIGHVAVYDPQIVHPITHRTAAADAATVALSPSYGQTSAESFAAAQWAMALGV
jgi:hypothetical protein